jgi:hypothetical protein
MEVKTFATEEEAQAAGYATFNHCTHYAIDVPDGISTVTLKTSEGKRLTIALLPYNHGAAPQCADISYHDSGVEVMTKSREPSPGMHAILWTGEREHDTRRDAKPFAFLTVLMDDCYADKKEDEAGAA